MLKLGPASSGQTRNITIAVMAALIITVSDGRSDIDDRYTLNEFLRTWSGLVWDATGLVWHVVYDAFCP